MAKFQEGLSRNSPQKTDTSSFSCEQVTAHEAIQITWGEKKSEASLERAKLRAGMGPVRARQTGEGAAPPPKATKKLSILTRHFGGVQKVGSKKFYIKYCQCSQKAIAVLCVMIHRSITHHNRH